MGQGEQLQPDFSVSFQKLCKSTDTTAETKAAITQSLRSPVQTFKIAQDFIRALGDFYGIELPAKLTQKDFKVIAKAVESNQDTGNKDKPPHSESEIEKRLWTIQRDTQKRDEFLEAVNSTLDMLLSAGQKYTTTLELAQIIAASGAEAQVHGDALELSQTYAPLVAGARELFWKNLPLAGTSIPNDQHLASLRKRIHTLHNDATAMQAAWEDLVRFLARPEKEETKTPANAPATVRELFGPHTIEQLFDMVRDKDTSADRIVDALQGQPKLRGELKYHLVKLRFVMPNGIITDIDERPETKNLQERQRDAVRAILSNPEGKFDKAAWEVIVKIMKRSRSRFRPQGV